MKVALCCIGKMENDYIQEYVEYYYNLGFDKIFLYDNNDIDGEKFEDAIGEYIGNNFVELINYRGEKVCQLKAYQDCYDKHNKEYDWIAFFDCDEFLTFKDDKDINEYLNNEIFNKFQIIHINWMCYGDNDLLRIENDNYSVLDRFKKPVLPYDFTKTYSFPENNHIKSIIRGGVNGIKWNSNPHTPSNTLPCCNNFGERIFNSASPFSKYNFDKAYIRHYSCKTAEEFYVKTIKGFPDHILTENDRTVILENFFKYNKDTQEKRKIFHLTNEKVDIFIGSIKDVKYDIQEPYKLLMLGETESNYKNSYYDNNGDNISYINKSLCEFTGMYWVWKNYPLKDYIGFCQYRKMIPKEIVNNIHNIFKTNDIIIANQLTTNPNIAAQYAIFHNIEDLQLLETCIKEIHPEYTNAFVWFTSNKIMFSNNCFIMPKDKFMEYCEFIWGTISLFMKKTNINTYEDCINRVEKNKEKYLKDYKSCPQNGTIDYQARFLAYLAERLTTVFVITHFKKPYIFKTITMEKKYQTE